MAVGGLCYHNRRPAPWSRIEQQLQRESAFVDVAADSAGNEFTAWEFHSYLSPLPGPCDWGNATAGRNASGGLYQQYKRYVEGLFRGRKAGDAPPSSAVDEW